MSMKHSGLLSVAGLVTLPFSGCSSTPPAEMLTPAIAMPEWLRNVEEEAFGHPMPGDEAKLKFVIGLAAENVRRGTGGPFGAAIFDLDSDQLIAVGVNSVVPAKQSWAHAEMTAFARAQHKLGTFSLKNCILATSCEPCAMCTGATPWSGVEVVLYGAPGSEARAIGFDEGDKLPLWKESLMKRGIRVSGPMLQEEARQPFLLYQNSRGKIY